jgi:hypothetical protein
MQAYMGFIPIKNPLTENIRDPFLPFPKEGIALSTAA